jgi:hypothetical protein
MHAILNAMGGVQTLSIHDFKIFQVQKKTNSSYAEVKQADFVLLAA